MPTTACTSAHGRAHDDRRADQRAERPPRRCTRRAAPGPRCTPRMTRKIAACAMVGSAWPTFSVAGYEAVRHQLAELDPGGRRRERADAERVEEIGDRAEADRLTRSAGVSPCFAAVVREDEGERDAECRERGKQDDDVIVSPPFAQRAYSTSQNGRTCSEGSVLMHSNTSPGAAWAPSLLCLRSARGQRRKRRGHPARNSPPQALEMLKRSVGFKTVEGEGQVPAYAEYLAGELKAHGFAAEDIEITPRGETATLVARYPRHRPEGEADPHRRAHGRRRRRSARTGSATRSRPWSRTASCSAAARTTTSSAS